jgi:hypothetical protein
MRNTVHGADDQLSDIVLDAIESAPSSTGVVDSRQDRASSCRAVRDIEEAQIIINAMTVRFDQPVSIRAPP